MTVPDVSPDVPPRTWRLLLALLGRLPQAALSRSFGRIADVRLPYRLRRPVLGAFARSVGIDLDEAAHPLEHYRSLNDFFVRTLRDGARSWPGRPEILASPVDGVIGQLGEIRDGRALQAKGRWYSVAELVENADSGDAFEGGTFITIYLSPRHYHRIHAPFAGSVTGATHVPGGLLPVNEAAVTHIPNLFARNERLICWMEGEFGKSALVAVGAYNVGRISARFDPEWQAREGEAGWATNRRGAVQETRRYDPPFDVSCGDEVMAFHLGSTIVLILEPGKANLFNDIVPGTEVRLGQPLGKLADTAERDSAP